MADAKKLSDNQIAALATFFGGASELLNRTFAKGDTLTLDDAKLALDVINVGVVITAAQLKADLSHHDVYGNKSPEIDDELEEQNNTLADVLDLEEYRAKGGLLN